VLAIVATGLALSALWAPLRAQEDATLLRRAFTIGVSPEARAKAAESINPHVGKLQLDNFDAAEFAAPPPACGLSVYRRFGQIAKERFQVATASTCRITATQVDCPTHYLPRYSRVYLELKYHHIAAKQMTVSLDTKQRAPEGSVAPGTGALSQNDKLTITEFFDVLLEEAMCRRRDGKS